MSLINENLPVVTLTKEEIFNLPHSIYLNRPAILDIFKPKYQTLDELLDLAFELESWKPPAHFQDMCSYKFAGYDTQNRPVWYCKLGDYSVKDVIEQGEVELMERYFWQAILYVVNSIVAKTPEENPSQQAVCIVDAGQMTNYRKFLHGPSLALIYKMATKYKEGCRIMLGLGIAINLKKSGVVKFFLKFLKPIVGELIARVELMGTDESQWLSRLVELFGDKEIPEFEGTDLGPVPYRVVLAP